MDSISTDDQPVDQNGKPYNRLALVFTLLIGTFSTFFNFYHVNYSISYPNEIIQYFSDDRSMVNNWIYVDDGNCYSYYRIFPATF